MLRPPPSSGRCAALATSPWSRRSLSHRAQGPLWKAGSGAGLFHSSESLRRRFFDLDDEFLCYYSSSSSNAGFYPSGTIELDEISSVASCGDFHGADRGTGRQHFPFDVVTEERTYHLHAESEEERRGWMDALAHNLALRRRRQGKA